MTKKNVKMDDETIKGFRKGIKKSDLIQSLDKEELERLVKTREFGEMDVGSLSYKIGIENDSVRMQIKSLRVDIEDTLITIAEGLNNARKLKLQLDTKNITETLPNGMVMNEAEIEQLIRKNKMISQVNVDKLPKYLGSLRVNAGVHGYDKKIILPVEEWEKEVLKVEESVNKMGFKLFT